MRILITGSAGMLGRDLLEVARAGGHHVVGVSRARLDITDAAAVRRIVAETGPGAVINCAAYTDVDGAETDPHGAHAVNAAGAGHVARAAAEARAWTVHMSTDYVFDGAKREPYVESDPTAPMSVYGASKLAGELAVAESAPGAHTIVRSSWLFGRGGRCFPDTILRLAGARAELSVVADQIGCPTFTGHLAGPLVALAERPVDGVVHIAGDGQCSWYEFAREIVAAGGAACEVRPCTTAEFPRPARRPAYSVLRTERGEGIPRLPDWRRGLVDYMAAAVAA